MSFGALKRSYGTSKQLEQMGVWVTVPLEEPDLKIEFLIARQSRANRAWATKITRIHKEIQDKVDAGALIDDESVDTSIRVFSEVNLLNWRTNGKLGLPNDKGEMVQYSPQLGFELLSDLPDLYQYVNKISLNKTIYQQQQQAIIEKKSETTSDGS